MSAAGIPIKEARKLVMVATFKLLNVALTHSFEVKKFSYHRSEIPRGGNSKYFAELIEIGRTTKRGSTRKIKTHAQ